MSMQNLQTHLDYCADNYENKPDKVCNYQVECLYLLCGKFTSHSSCAIVIEHWQNQCRDWRPELLVGAYHARRGFYAYSTVISELWWTGQGHRKGAGTY